MLKRKRDLAVFISHKFHKWQECNEVAALKKKEKKRMQSQTTLIEAESLNHGNNSPNAVVTV